MDGSSRVGRDHPNRACGVLAAVLAQVRGMCLAAPPTAAPPSTARRRRG